jgi:hypothetical protein
MRQTQWIESTRTTLQQGERGDLLTALTADQESHLLEHDYVWVEKVGVLWNATDGAMRRARFTHGTHFRTKCGEFYLDSEGSVSEISNPIPDPASEARPHNVGAHEVQASKAA